MCLAWKFVLISPLSFNINTEHWILSKGWKRKRREIRERERIKSRKRRKEFHQFWIQHPFTCCGVQGLGGTHLDFVGVSIYSQVFFTLEISILLSMQISFLLDLFGKASLLGFYKSFPTQRSLQLWKVLWFHDIMPLQKIYFHRCVDKAHFLKMQNLFTHSNFRCIRVSFS